MILPGRTCLMLTALAIAVLIAAPMLPALLPAALLLDVALLALVLLEGWLLPRRNELTAEPTAWPRLELGATGTVGFWVANRSRRAVTVTVRPYFPLADLAVDEPEQVVTVAAHERALVRFNVRPLRRGRTHLPTVELTVRGQLDLARRRWTHPVQHGVMVFPNLRAVAEYEQLRRHRALRQFGVHRMRMIGAGREFEQLREYMPDDDFGDINWKATARRREPITNVYQAERAQDLLLAVECGRMMGNPVGARTALDHAVDAAIMLTHLSVRGGDRVGLALFRDTVTTFLKPAGGQQAAKRVVEKLTDAQSEGVFPSFSELAQAVRVNQNRRAMLFLFTDLNDPQLARNLAQVMPQLARRHVCVVVSLYDALLAKVADAPAHSPAAVCQVLAARRLAAEREAHTRELVKAGVQVLQCAADQVTLDVINRYLQIKMRQMV